MTRRVAVFGGTFDPPHIGHLVVANEVLHRLAFDEVLMVVANDPYQKSGSREISAPALRLAMVEAAIDARPGLTASDIEIARGGSSYTINTVETLVADQPDTEFSLVLGADTVATLDSWHRADELRSMISVVAVDRPSPAEVDAQMVPAGWNVTSVRTPAIDISSTEIRARCVAGITIDYLVADAVRSIIAEHGLYGVRR